jgi:hyaluronoglucosaminidase
MRRIAVCLAAVAALLPRGAAAQSHAFAFRGVIEGFYGPPWTHDAVVQQLVWMGAHGLNVFVHAPKDDPYQRANWRAPYPPSQMAAFTDEVVTGRSAGVDWVPNLSVGFPLIPAAPDPSAPPSSDICFSCPADLDVVYAKLDPFFDAGTRTLMLSFDDVQKLSSHAEDASAYGVGDEAYGRMNRDLLNAVYRHYAARDASFTLLTVLADYSGTGDTPYLQGVRSGGGLDPGIAVMWTGTAVVSRTIEPDGAAAYASRVGRDKVLIWDNYPVNDYTGGALGYPTRLFLGPYEGRASDLPRSVSGILANPMIEPVASRIALGTMAEYLASPETYQPEPAWERAIADVGGERADEVRSLAENSRSSTLDRSESQPFVALRDEFLRAIDTPFWSDAALAFDRYIVSEANAHDPRNPLFREALPWLARLSYDAGTARWAMLLLAAERPELRNVTSETLEDGSRALSGTAKAPSPAVVATYTDYLERDYAQSLARPYAVHGDRLAQDFNTLYVNENRLDAFLAEAHRRTVSWLASAPLAASAVRVTVNGAEVPLDAEGRFSATVPAGPVEVIATDGAGGQTGIVL